MVKQHEESEYKMGVCLGLGCGSHCHLGLWENKGNSGKDVCRTRKGRTNPEALSKVRGAAEGKCQPGKSSGSGHLRQGAQLGKKRVYQAWWERPVGARGRSEATEGRLLRDPGMEMIGQQGGCFVSAYETTWRQGA